jgi:hypothetical protein
MRSEALGDTMDDHLPSVAFQYPDLHEGVEQAPPSSSPLDGALQYLGRHVRLEPVPDVLVAVGVQSGDVGVGQWLAQARLEGGDLGTVRKVGVKLEPG